MGIINQFALLIRLVAMTNYVGGPTMKIFYIMHKSKSQEKPKKKTGKQKQKQGINKLRGHM